jgi:L-lactate dehydrogenase complex protein LldE
MPQSSTHSSKRPPANELRVALFVTCLADLMRPSVAFASLTLLQRAGYRVEVPEAQSCCGQPAYNSGNIAATIPVAQAVIATFEGYDCIVAPSGSCAGMLRHHYPQLLEGEWRERAEAMAARVWELTSFLHDMASLKPLPPAACGRLPATITYHDSCAGLREMGVKQQPRNLLRSVCRLEVNELAQTEVCCGFGGTFCAKMPEISAEMADDKLDSATATGAGLVVGGDLGCLLNLAGRASRRGLPLEFRHVAELLAGDLERPPIGEPEAP